MSGIAHRRWRRPGRLNARDSSARLRSSTSVSEVMITGPDDRQQAAQPGAQARPPCRGRGRAGSRRSSRRARRGSAPPRSSRRPTNANAWRHARVARGRRRTRADRSSGRTARSTTRSRTAGRASGARTRRPRAVASNGPIGKRTVVPARVNTLTSTTEIAIGRVSSSEMRSRGARGRPRRQANSSISDDDRDRPDVAAEDERSDRADGRDDRLGQRVEPVVRTRRGRDEPGDPGGIVRLEVVGPDDPGRRTPDLRLLQADRLLTLREARDEATRQRLEHDEHDEERRRSCRSGRTAGPAAGPQSGDPRRPAGTRRRGGPCPDPVTPPKTTAAIGAEMIADTMPQIRPAIAT